MEPTSELNIEQKIMGEIKSGRLKLRSKYIFWAEKLGLKSALVFTIILAILFFNLVLFYMRSTDHLQYLSFGRAGLRAYLESFPYLLVAGFVLLMLIAGYLIGKSDWAYKKTFSNIAIVFVLSVMLIGAALAYSGLPQRIENHAYGPGPGGRMLRPFFDRGFERRGHGLAGIIDTINDTSINVRTPRGLVEMDVSAVPANIIDKLAVGQFIMAIGEQQAGKFIAKHLRPAEPGAMPMIDRGIERRFQGFPPPPPPPPAPWH